MEEALQTAPGRRELLDLLYWLSGKKLISPQSIVIIFPLVSWPDYQPHLHCSQLVKVLIMRENCWCFVLTLRHNADYNSPPCRSSAFSGGGWAECPETCWHLAAPERRQAWRPARFRPRACRGRWGRSRRCRCRDGGDGVCWGGSPAPPSHPPRPAPAGETGGDSTWPASQSLMDTCLNTHWLKGREIQTLVGDVFLWRVKMSDIIFLTNIFTPLPRPSPLPCVWL